MRKFKRLCILLAILVIMVSGVAIWDFAPAFIKQPGFEAFFKGSFNMTPDEIKLLHEDVPKESENARDFSYILTYERTFADHSATLNYVFLERGLVFKQYRLFVVKWEFPVAELSINECQELAESLIPLLTPYFESDEYDYHGRVVERRNPHKYVWAFWGSFLKQDLYVGISGDKNFISNQLSLIFMQNTKRDRIMTENIVSENHEGALSQIQWNRKNYGEFDYDKWRDVPATFKEQETSGN